MKLKRKSLLVFGLAVILILAMSVSAMANASVGGTVEPDSSDLIHEQLWIESPTDSDKDGERDLLYVTITRPKTDTNVKLASLVSISPYDYSDWEPIWEELRDVDIDYPGADNPETTTRTYADVEYDGHTYDEIVAADFKPDWLPAERTSTQVGSADRIAPWLGNTDWRNYFISQGDYAAVAVHMIGGKMSEGLLQDGGYDECVAPLLPLWIG